MFFFKSVFYVTTGSSWMSFINAQRSQSSCKVTQPFECHPLAGPQSNQEKNMLASHLLVIIINNGTRKSGLLDLCPFIFFSVLLGFSSITAMQLTCPFMQWKLNFWSWIQSYDLRVTHCCLRVTNGKARSLLFRVDDFPFLEPSAGNVGGRKILVSIVDIGTQQPSTGDKANEEVVIQEKSQGLILFCLRCKGTAGHYT